MKKPQDNQIRATFEWPSDKPGYVHTLPANIDPSVLPRRGDYFQQDGLMFRVERVTWNYDGIKPEVTIRAVKVS